MLTDTAIRKAKTDKKQSKLHDEKGLYLLCKPTGSKGWRFKYRLYGKEKLLSLGVYPDVSLKEAREKRDAARRQIAQGIDPSLKRKAGKQADTNTFAALAREWLSLQAGKLSYSTYQKAEWMLERLVCPYIGSQPIATVTAQQLLSVYRRLESRGKHETAHRTRQRCGQVFRFAIATGRAERDPTADLKGALAPVAARNRAAITDPKQIRDLLRALAGYNGHFPTHCALRLAPLVFVRPGELRAAEWAEIDLENAEWRIPAARTKMREAHVVPLARQAVAVLSELQPLTGRGQYVFPSIRSNARPMSENTINGALRRLGYTKEEMTGHGFRALASTRLNEMGWKSEVIERQLAHAERNKVKAAYNRAEHMEERRKMMQWWADYLDDLEQDRIVTPLNNRQA